MVAYVKPTPVPPSECRQTHNHRAGTFRIQVIRHDVLVELRDVKQLQELWPPHGLIRGESAACVLHPQDQIDGLLESLVGDVGREALNPLQEDDDLDGLGGGVRHGVGLVARRLPVDVVHAEGILADLRVVDEFERFAQDGLVFEPRGQSGVRTRSFGRTR